MGDEETSGTERVALETILEVLERYAIQHQPRERLELATAALEHSPACAELYAHRVSALLDLEGIDAARNALQESSIHWMNINGTPPDCLLPVYRTVALRRVMDDASGNSPTMKNGSDSVEIDNNERTQMPLEPGHLERVNQESFEKMLERSSTPRTLN